MDFQTGNFADFEKSKIDSHFNNFGQVKINPSCLLLLLWAGHSYFTEFEQDIKPWKTIQILSVWQKIQEPHIGSATSHLQWFN